MTFKSRKDAIKEITHMFGQTEFNTKHVDHIYWPSISARGHTLVEIREIKGKFNLDNEIETKIEQTADVSSTATYVVDELNKTNILELSSDQAIALKYALDVLTENGYIEIILHNQVK